MFDQNKQFSNTRLLTAVISAFCWTGGAAMATDPLQAAQDLAGTGQADPNGLTLMIVSICMLFVFALSIIIAISLQAFKKKPTQRRFTAHEDRTEAGTVSFR